MLILLFMSLLGGGGLYLHRRQKKRQKAAAESSANAVLRAWGAARLKAREADHWWQRAAGRIDAHRRMVRAGNFADQLITARAGEPK